MSESESGEWSVGSGVVWVGESGWESESESESESE